MPKPAAGRIAIVGMACQYPDADSPEQLWQNVLHRRRSFRRIPAGRLPFADYHSADPTAPDRTYSAYAAVLDGWQFDRARFGVPGTAFRSADLTHWLALDVTSRALADAGFAEAQGLPTERTGVVLGNTLTGEFTRAAVTLRLRWPYVRRLLDSALQAEGWASDRRQDFLAEFEVNYKRPFAPIGDESLAGALSNTIAGRICNHYDLRGGGYVIDGACSSSLLAVSRACAALDAGELDVALAGGVDLSLDPFELVGFAKTGALATDLMRVYDRRSNGFWPGEGCGFVVLMRAEDAEATGKPGYATITGWGISSDGAGGITRPTVAGHLLAAHRAYQRAGYSAGTVELFEGHGTGTAVGDQAELTALTQLGREAGSSQRAAVGSVKANIGHTKAAAGIAGLLKAALSVHHAVLPPVTGCELPHPLLTEDSAALRVLADAEEWTWGIRRAGVSAMGFGGINTHLTLQSAEVGRSRPAPGVSSVAPDCELLLLAAADPQQLREQLQRLADEAADLSFAELTDLAVASLAGVDTGAMCRAALVAAHPAELADAAKIALRRLAEANGPGLVVDGGVCLGIGTAARVGLLFPGQGSPSPRTAGILGRLCPQQVGKYFDGELGDAVDPVDTAVAQPAIVRGSLAGLAWLTALGVAAETAVGHSLGEIIGLCWAGCLDERTTLDIAAKRGAAMREHGAADGAMASIAAGEAAVRQLLAGTGVVLAGLNAPEQTVVSGRRGEVAAVLSRAEAHGYPTVPLRVSHAFHSPQVAPAAETLAEFLRGVDFQPPHRRLISTVTGSPVTPDTKPVELLVAQVTSPVRFATAITVAAKDVDLFVEVGPGKALTGLAGQCGRTPVVSTDVGADSARDLFTAAAALFAAGQLRDLGPLATHRFARPFQLGKRRLFLTNPCEPAEEPQPVRAEEPPQASQPASAVPQPVPDPVPQQSVPHPVAQHPTDEDPLHCVRTLVAEVAELPIEAVLPENRLLADLHLSSLRVAGIATAACDRLGRTRPVTATSFADASVGELAKALAELPAVGADGPEKPVAGVADWVRAFVPELVPRPRPRKAAASPNWQLHLPDGHPLAEAIRAAFPEFPGGQPAILAALPSDAPSDVLAAVLSAAQTAAKSGADFTLLQHGGGGGAIAKTLQAEYPELRCTVLDVPATVEGVRWAADEAVLPAGGFREVHYDQTGRRLVPTLTPLPLPPVRSADRLPLTGTDVLLVAGGGKGIGYQCAYDLARTTEAALLLLGRAVPGQDVELDANLARLTAADIRFDYVSTDVCDAAAVAAAVAKATIGLGPVTAIVHSVGRNDPRPLAEITPDELRAHLAPKLAGLENLLAAVETDQLRLLLTFGSIIGRMGLSGEAHYAAANEWLARRVGEIAAELPHCHCLNLEWSVWSGAGMGERLGVLDALMRVGVTPIPVDAGTDMMRRLLVCPPDTSTVLVTGRYARQETMLLTRTDPPLSRFLERPVLHYPGVELVADADLSTDTDRYLTDHVVDGVPLLPAVVGLEIMAQAATAVPNTPVPYAAPLRFTDVRLHRPLLVPEDGKQTIRTAALIRDDGDVDVVLRSAETAFAANHFSARIAVGNSHLPVSTEPAHSVPDFPGRDDLVTDLYGGLFFHGPRFRRVLRYDWLDARHCTAWIDASGWDGWFGGFHSTALLMGDPGARDAVIHMNQSCLPQRRLLPVAVADITLHQRPYGIVLATAEEREQIGDEYVYDIQVTDEQGELCEVWHGLRMRDVGPLPAQARWHPQVFGAYLQRGAEALAGVRLDAVTVHRTTGKRAPGRSGSLLNRMVGAGQLLPRRTGGRPVTTGERRVSASHIEGWTMAATAGFSIGCDWETVVDRPSNEWTTLLGQSDRFGLAELLAQETAEPLNAGATRVWTAIETLIKADRATQPLTLRSVHPDGWLVLEAGDAQVVSVIAYLADVEAPVAAAILLEHPA